ncbi:MAG: glutamate racemase [Salinivirgaceae bacterium]|jgi:glutamate racemase|nr:glutamate racemase [Salinivirgaceae bacterium]
MRNNPIGIFDSGIGGLSVWQEVKKLLPAENIIYIADSINCPYGTKSQEEIIALSIKNTEFLLAHQCKLIVVACNTATSAAIDILRAKYSIPFIGMEPAIKPAALNTNTGKIGVLATKGTFEGQLFKETSKKFATNVNTVIQIGEGLVELVEQGKANSKEAIPILKENLDAMLNAGVDQIVLGCTHYPFFTRLIKDLIPKSIKIIDPAPAIAQRTKSVLAEKKIANDLNKASYSFYNTGNSLPMQSILKEINCTEKVIFTTLI